MNTLMHIVLDLYEALPDSICKNIKNNAKNCFLNRYSDYCYCSFTARETHMPWIFIGLIYIICITSTDAIYSNYHTFGKMDEVNENIRCASICEGSSRATREGMLPDNVS